MSQTAGSATPGFRPARPRADECGEARLVSSGRWASVPVPLAVLDMSRFALPERVRAARVTAVTGTGTGSGRAGAPLTRNEPSFLMCPGSQSTGARSCPETKGQSGLA